MNIRKNYTLALIIVLVFACLFPLNSFAAEKEKGKSKDKFEVPSHVLSISKENTFPNTTEDQQVVEPSKLTKSLLEDVDIPIENPDLIKQLNETTLNPSP